MHPPELPVSVRDDPARRAETVCYDALTALDDDHHVFYSTKWQARDTHGRMRDGESDFVVAHAARGWLVIEVKGGRVAYQGVADGWVSLDQNGFVRRGSKDPVDQATETIRVLEALFQGRSGWSGAKCTRGHAVMFPDLRLPHDTPLPPHVAAGWVLDAPALDDIPRAIAGVFNHYRNADHVALGPERLQILVDMLDGWVTLPVSVSRAALAQRVTALTEEQMRLLQIMGKLPRVSFSGCAGSGKTLLAMEKARRLAAAGQRVLLTCYNKLLGEFMAGQVGAGVTARHFHGLCADLAEESGAPLEHLDTVTQEYFDEVLPARLAAAAAQLGRRYDALILDEAQDFRDSHWPALLSLLADPDHGVIYVFFDDTQNIFTPAEHGLSAGADQLSGLTHLTLSRNCRSTAAIHRVAMAFRPGDPPSCENVEGEAVEVATYGGQREAQKAARRVLHRWLVDDRLDPDEVLILTGHTPKPGTAFAPGTRLGNFELTADEAAGPGRVRVATVQSVKGIERRAILLADLDEQVHPDLETVLYVGCSRAQERLALLLGADVPASIHERLRAAGARYGGPQPADV